MLVNFLAFITKYFVGTGIELKNPHPRAGGEPLDKDMLKKLEEIIAK